MRQQPRTIDAKYTREGWVGIVQWPKRKYVTRPYVSHKQAIMIAAEIASRKGK